MSGRTDVQAKILPASEARNWVHTWPTAVVSLVNPEDGHLVARSPRPLDTLRIFVADVTDPEHEHAARSGDVAELIAFGERLEDGAKVLFHCRGGIGRSPAAAVITLVAAGWSPAEALDEVEQVRRVAKPNSWFLLLADALMTPAQRHGVFSSYVAWASQKAWWYPVPNAIVRDAVAGRLDWSKSCDLVRAQTHRERDVDRGPFR